MNMFRKLWDRWKAFGRLLGNIVARVALSIFYFTVFAPFGLGVRWFSDPLQIKARPDSLWRPRSTIDLTLTEVERQF